MRDEYFNIKTPTVAIERGDDHTTCLVLIPVGTTVKVMSDFVDDNRLVDVDWNGRVVMMFTRDLFERGEKVDQ